jgi:hypothetical protein
MHSKKYNFQNISISPESPLLKHLNIKPGDYYGQFDFSVGKLFLKNKKDKNNNGARLELTVTLEQLLVILAMAGRVEGDKFTSQDITTMTEVARKSTFSSKEKGFVAHHVIPIKVWEHSKLTLRAKRPPCNVDENNPINRLLVPVYFHKGNHPTYSDDVMYILEKEWSYLVRDGEENDCEAIMQVLNQVIDYLKDKITEMIAAGICSIDDAKLTFRSDRPESHYF